jgi:hypothetical protein
VPRAPACQATRPTPRWAPRAPPPSLQAEQLRAALAAKESALAEAQQQLEDTREALLRASHPPSAAGEVEFRTPVASGGAAAPPPPPPPAAPKRTRARTAGSTAAREPVRKATSLSLEGEGGAPAPVAEAGAAAGGVARSGRSRRSSAASSVAPPEQA